jgi:hypothetical protein
MIPNELYIEILSHCELNDWNQFSNLSERFYYLIHLIEYKKEVKFFNLENINSNSSNINLTNISIVKKK